MKLIWLMVVAMLFVVAKAEDEKALVNESKNSIPLPQIEADNKMPILDAMNQNGPRMLQFPFDLINTMREKFFQMAGENNLDMPQEDSNPELLPKKKILSILIIRHKNNDKTESSLSIDQEPDLNRAKIFSRAKFLFFPSLFSDNNNNNNAEKNLFEDEDFEKKKVPMLGGKDDPDNPKFFPSFFESDQSENDQENEAEMGHNGMMHHKKKKCMMLGFMRMKASVYYRTIVHLLFVSGLILFVLLLSVLCMRIYKRRNLSRYYSQNMHISTIDEGKKPSGLLMFNEKLSESILISAPPAYDQVMKAESEPKRVRFLAFRTGGSSLINSLLQAYRNRYSSVRKEADTNSVSSLPAYEAATADSKVNTEQI